MNVYQNGHDWWIGESAEAVERQYEHETGVTREEYDE